MGRKRSTSFYGEGAHQRAYGQCSAIADAPPAGSEQADAKAPSTSEREEEKKRRAVPTALSIPDASSSLEFNGSGDADGDQGGPGTVTPKPIRRQPTQMFSSSGRPSSLSVHEKVKLLLSGRSSVISDDEEVWEASSFSDQPVERPSEAEIARFREILRTYNFTDGPHESIDMLAKDCEWASLSQIAARIYNFFRWQEDKGSKLSQNEFELKALVDDFLIRVFDRDERQQQLLL